MIVATVWVCLCVSRTDNPDAKRRFWQGVFTAGNNSAEKIKLLGCGAWIWPGKTEQSGNQGRHSALVKVELIRILLADNFSIFSRFRRINTRLRTGQQVAQLMVTSRSLAVYLAYASCLQASFINICSQFGAGNNADKLTGRGCCVLQPRPVRSQNS